MPYEFKIILLGESGVGKTSLIHSYTTGYFNPNRNATSVVSRMAKTFTLKRKQIKLFIWNTSSQTFFKNVASNYYDGFLLVYDVTNTTTLNDLSEWLKLLRKKNGEAAVLVVGNKIDLPDCNSISHYDVIKFVEDERLERIESSAKNGHNVTEIFECLTLKILEAKKLISKEEISCESSMLSNVNDVENTSSDISHKSFDDENSNDISHKSINDENCNDISRKNFDDENSNNISKKSFDDQNSNDISHKTFDDENSNDINQKEFDDGNSNDIDYKSFNDEISSTNTYFNQCAVHEAEQLPVLNLKSPKPPLEPESSQPTTNYIENGHSNIPQADLANGGGDDDDMEEIEQSFVFVSFLPPVVPLPDDTPLLRESR